MWSIPRPVAYPCRSVLWNTYPDRDLNYLVFFSEKMNRVYDDLILHITTDKFFIESFSEQQVRFYIKIIYYLLAAMPLEAPEVVGEGDLILHITTDKFFIESFSEQQVRKL